MAGAVAGAPGAYSNRSDLNAGTQPIRAVPSRQYGQRTQQEQSQQAVPLPDFAAPSVRPHEPVTAGMNTGPGPSAVEAGIPSAPDSSQSTADQLRAVYQMFPTSDLADLIASLSEP